MGGAGREGLFCEYTAHTMEAITEALWGAGGLLDKVRIV